MKSAIRISITALGLASFVALALAGCSDRGKFENMPKDQQIKSIQYTQDHPTPLQQQMVAKMKAGMGAPRTPGAKAGPPAMPAPTPNH